MKADVATCVLTYTYTIKKTHAAMHEDRHNKSGKSQCTKLQMGWACFRM